MSRIRSHTYITQICNSSFCMNSESTTVKKYTTLLNEFFQSIFTASITIQSLQRAKFALITSNHIYSHIKKREYIISNNNPIKHIYIYRQK